MIKRVLLGIIICLSLISRTSFSEETNFKCSNGVKLDAAFLLDLECLKYFISNPKEKQIERAIMLFSIHFTSGFQKLTSKPADFTEKNIKCYIDEVLKKPSKTKNLEIKACKDFVENFGK